MGVFTGVGGIIGGIKGLNDQAPEILDFFEPGEVFGGLRAGGLRFKLRGNRLITQRGKRARTNQRQVEGVIKGTRRTGRKLQVERRRLGKLRRNLLGLRDQVRPGFGRLTAARVKAIERAESRALGNLREQFGARNVLGSSFAAREEASLVAEFGNQEEEARAQAIIEEIGTTLGIDRELLNVSEGQRVNLATKMQAIQLRLAAVQTKIRSDFAEAGLAANIQQSVLDLAARFAFAQTGLEAQAAADRGAAFQSIFSGLDQAVDPLATRSASAFGFGVGPDEGVLQGSGQTPARSSAGGFGGFF